MTWAIATVAPLPIRRPGGTIDLLRPLVTVKKADFDALVACLVAWFFADKLASGKVSRLQA